jgi:D-glycerate 3-kinase
MTLSPKTNSSAIERLESSRLTGCWGELWRLSCEGADAIALLAVILVPRGFANGAGDRGADRDQVQNLPGTLPEDLPESLLLRAEFLRAVIPKFTEFCQESALNPEQLLPLLWQVALPLALELGADYRRSGRPIVQGILGGQGVGKSTLGALLGVLLREQGLGLVSLSLDDLYLPYADRQALLRRDPRLIWRGPPGTHDVVLGVETLDRLRRGEDLIPLPRFDKSLQGGSGDRMNPDWVAAPAVIIFEGWFVGAQPIDPQVFEGENLPDPICSEADRAFAQDCNARLAEYLPLWDRLDRQLILAFGDYRQSKYWRRRAEAQMRDQGKPGMSDDEIDRFVDYFWRALHPELFIEPLFDPGFRSATGDRSAWVVRYGADRSIESVQGMTGQSQPGRV